MHSVSFLLVDTSSGSMVKRCLFHLTRMVPGCDVVADIVQIVVLSGLIRTASGSH